MKKNLKSLMTLCVLSGLVNYAKADIEDVKETPTGHLMVRDPNAAIGPQKTPWVLLSPDGQRAFANCFTTNAISLASEDGINFYAHVENEGENGVDRTKVIHFTAKAGIPSGQGEVIDTKDSGEENNFENMKTRTLIGVKNGYLMFSNDLESGLGRFFSYNPQTGDMKIEETLSQYDTLYQKGSDLYTLQRTKTKYQKKKVIKKAWTNGLMDTMGEASTSMSDTCSGAMTVMGDKTYIGGILGKIMSGVGSNKVVAQMPFFISGLSNNGQEVFATSSSTNAFLNVTEGLYNVARDANGNLKPMVPRTKDSLVKVIDNRKHPGGKFLVFTRKGWHAIDD